MNENTKLKKLKNDILNTLKDGSPKTALMISRNLGYTVSYPLLWKLEHDGHILGYFGMQRPIERGYMRRRFYTLPTEQRYG